MATGQEFVTGALSKLGRNTAEEPIESYEIDQGIEILNDMLSEWEESGPQLGFIPLAKPAETVRVPRGAHDAIKGKLAMRWASNFDIPVTPALVMAVDEAFNNLLVANEAPIRVNLPDTLPIGTAEDCGYLDDRFFPYNEEENF